MEKIYKDNPRVLNMLLQDSADSLGSGETPKGCEDLPKLGS